MKFEIGDVVERIPTLNPIGKGDTLKIGTVSIVTKVDIVAFEAGYGIRVLAFAYKEGEYHNPDCFRLYKPPRLEEIVEAAKYLSRLK